MRVLPPLLHMQPPEKPANLRLVSPLVPQDTLPRLLMLLLTHHMPLHTPQKPRQQPVMTSAGESMAAKQGINRLNALA